MAAPVTDPNRNLPAVTRVGSWHERIDWKRTALVVVMAILVYQVVLPLLMILWTSLKGVRPDNPGFLLPEFTLANFGKAVAAKSFGTIVANTLVFAAGSTLLGFSMGAFLAWALHRTNTPFRRFISLLMLGRLMIPAILIAVAWMWVASPRIGLANKLLEAMFGVADLLNVRNMWGMVFVESLNEVPLAYLMMAAALQSMDPRLEEASSMTANTLRTLWRITLPVVMPAVGAALLLIFIRSLGAFEVPMIIGTRSGVHLLTSEIYLKTRVFPTDWGMASAYGMMLLSAALLCLPLYYRTIRHSERYQTITGKDFRPRIIDLGRWRPVTGGLCLFIVFLVTGVPFLTLLYFSVLNATWVPLGELAGALTLQNYIGLLGLEGKASVLRFFWNSTVVALGTATAVLLLVSVISYFVNKTRVRNRRLLDVLAFMPIAIPDIVLGTAFLWFYLLLKAPIYGTLLMPMLAYTTLFMPLALRFVSTSIVQIHSDIEEAAELTGVPWWKNLLRIYLPLIRPGFLAGWFWVMVHSYRELTLSLLLTQRRNNTVAVIMFDRYEEGLFNEVAALGVMLFVVLLILVAIVYQLSKRYGLQEQA